MSPEAQRIAIAEATQRRKLVEKDGNLITYNFNGRGWYADRRARDSEYERKVFVRNCMDYLGDLNAAHEMEAHLGFIDTEGTLTIAYEENLRSVMKDCGWPIWYATAKHRSEAFLKTLGLWKEGE